MTLLIAQEVVKAVKSVNELVVLTPTLGGSVPLYVFEEELKARLSAFR